MICIYIYTYHIQIAQKLAMFQGLISQAYWWDYGRLELLLGTTYR